MYIHNVGIQVFFLALAPAPFNFLLTIVYDEQKTVHFRFGYGASKLFE